MIKTIYLNIEDDIPTVLAKIRGVLATEVVLVFPKKSYLLSDSLNLKLLKKELDIASVKASVLTMDSLGQAYAKEAGFVLRHLPSVPGSSNRFSDIGSASAQQRRPGNYPAINSIKAPMVRQQERPVIEQPRIQLPEKPVRSLPVNEPTKQQVYQKPPTVERVNSELVSLRTPRIKQQARSKVFPVKEKIEPRPLANLNRIIQGGVGSPDSPQGRNFLVPGEVNSVTIHQSIFPEITDQPKKLRSVNKKSNKALRYIFASFLLVGLIVAVILMVVVLPEGEVVIYPKTEQIVRDVELNASTGVTDIDLTAMVIPAERINKTVSGEKTFQTVGKKSVGEKATGKVRIINVSGKAISLKAETTKITLAGRQYHFLSDQNNIRALTPKEASSGNYQAIIAEIEADSGGEEYNLPQGTRMEITNQVFGTQPQVLYVKTETVISGGTSRFISQISDEDFTTAKEQLQESIVQRVVDQLAQDRVKLPEGAYSVQVTNFQSDKPLGTETPTFKAVLTINISGIGFSEDQVNSVIEDRILKSIPPNQKFKEDIGKNVVVKVNKIDKEAGLVQINAHVEATSIYVVEIDGVSSEILGKTKTEVSDLLLSKPEIERIDVVLSPFWRSAMPKFANKIKVSLSH